MVRDKQSGQMATTKVKGLTMGNIGIKINGEWVDLLSAFVPCQLCNEPVQIRELEDISSDSVNGVVTWQCAKCKAVNG